ncbi:MAG: MetQ/NlpA family ABC transporter substrate-binding protein [Succinivibrio sp.]
MKSLGLLTKALLVCAAAFSLCSCGDKKEESSSSIPSTIKVGVVPGPYRGMIDKHIRPIIEKQGYKIQFVEFTDYVQPDAALDSGDIDVNLMQHQKYLDGIVENQGLKLVGVVNVPTLGLGVFSDKYSSFDEVPEGAQIGIPTDAVNLSRALGIARDLGIITLKTENSEQKASIADIKDNPKKFRFVPMEAAQISRSLDSIDVGFIPGNYAYAAGLDYSKALGVEKVSEPIKNVVAVATKNKETLGKLFEDAVHSDDFVKSIEGDKEFDAFTRPAWWPAK